MLRREVKAQTNFGQRAKKIMDGGELIPDDLIMEMVAARLSERDARARGFILDGAPRTIAQAQQLGEIVMPDQLDLVLNLDVPTPVVLRRLAARRVCVD